MSCPLGYTAEDGVSNPHQLTSPLHSLSPFESSQPKQTDGRVAPPLPERKHRLHANKEEQQGTRVKQGPIPEWAAFCFAWHNRLWGMARALLLASFVLFLTPFLHLTRALSFRLPLLLPLPVSLARSLHSLTHPLFRAVQWLYTGIICCVIEGMGSTQLMMTGKIDNVFWQVKEQTPTFVVYVSNATRYTSFSDCIVFFMLHYRRKQMSNLYFLPFDQQEWSISASLLHLIFLSPLTVSSPSVLDLLLYSQSNASFVWFPECTSTQDQLPLSAPPSSADLSFVRSPTLSRCFTHLLDSLTVGASQRAEMHLLNCTLAYSGSVQHDVEVKYSHDLLDEADANELKAEVETRRTTNEEEVDEEEMSMNGYSDDTINLLSTRLSMRRAERGEMPSTIPIFWTAAPLRENADNTESYSPSASPSPSSSPSLCSSPSPQRARIVPNLYSFLCGNAPTHIHLLASHYDRAEIERISRSPSSSSPAAKQLSNEEERCTGYAPLVAALAAWIAHTFFHHNQQLSLFSLHSTYHLLPPSFSASSVPVVTPIHPYSCPVGRYKLALFLIIDWIAIVAATIATRYIIWIIIGK